MSGNTTTKTMLDRMSEERIFEITAYGADAANGFRIVEACDYYYGTTLTPNELHQLGAELMELARKATTGAR